jgi:lysophospholipase L1-like esterase
VIRRARPVDPTGRATEVAGVRTLALALAVVLAPLALVAGRARAATPPVYVALGDSTAVGVGADRGGGYPERLAQRLAAAGTPVRLVNLGVSGATAEDLRKTQVPRLAGEAPALVTIGIGLNDVVRGRPLAEFARDLEVAADAIARTKAVVVVSELPDLSRAPSAQIAPAALARRIAAYNATLRRVAERHGFAVGPVEVATRRAFAARPELFAQDGFHPSARGYEAWTDALWPTVQQALAPRVQARRGPGAR